MPKVLLIEDDASLTSFYISVFDRWGITYWGFPNGDLAMQAFEKISYHGLFGFDLVMTDLQFNEGEIDGKEVIRRVREKQPAIPIIVISGSVDDTVEGELKALGATDVVQKPVSLEKLKELLKHRLPMLT